MRTWFGFAVWLLERVGNIKIFMHENKSDRDKSFSKGAVIIMNHRTRLDWMFYFCILYRKSLLENIKIILKRGLEKVPGAGWAMQAALFIFINRKWDLDRLIFTKFIDYYHSIEKKAFILIFPEGTNLNDETKVKSDKFAHENNLEPYNYVLYPRVTGFSYVFNEMKRNDMIDSVHDVTVGYTGDYPFSEVDFVTGKIPEEIHFFIDKYKIDEIMDVTKTDEENKETLNNWLYKRWNAKEILLKSFYVDGLNSEKFKEVEADYVTERPNGPSTEFLKFYPILWAVLFSIMVYLIYCSVVYRIYIILALVFMAVIQVKGKSLQHLIMHSNNVFGAKKNE